MTLNRVHCQHRAIAIASCTVLLSSWIGQLSVHAQIIPDDTLGDESSQVVQDVIRGLESNRIEGGAIRGENLFHSFTEFNIEAERGAYFANPEGIANILSRVTGFNRSTIMGRLGVLGDANLFLLNPNGIVFGPQSSLDIAGSFVASTGDRFDFPDGSSFSATNPNDPPLLTVNLAPGLQYGARAATEEVMDSPPDELISNLGEVAPQRTIDIQGNLAVGTGQVLSLDSDDLTHRGSLSAPNGTVQLLGTHVHLLGNARIDVSAARGGGNIFIGGSFQGSGPLPNAQTTYIAPDVTLSADALFEGNGGTVVIWADGQTEFYGDISAQGGLAAGDGGFVEVSGKDSLIYRGTVSTAATNGLFGTLLIDPINITIADGDGLSDDDDGQVLDDDDGDGVDDDDFSGEDITIFEETLEGLAGNTNIELQATNNITIQDLADDALTFQPGDGTITFTADAGPVDANGVSVGDGVGAFTMDAGDAILTSGRDITITAAALSLGTIDTSPALGVVEVIDVDEAGPIPPLDALNEAGTSTFNFTVPDGTGEVQDLDVRFAAEHSYVGDLRVLLTSPNDTTAVLFDSVGGGGDNFQDTVLDSDAPDPIDNGAAPFDGTFAPQEDLSRFDNANPAGSWTLTVVDQFEQDSGQLLAAGNVAPWGESLGTQLLITTAAAQADAGNIDLNATNGSVDLGGDLIASGREGADGTISVEATGGVANPGNITLNETQINTREAVQLSATDTLTIEGLSDNTLAFQEGAGDITFTADADRDGVGNFTMNAEDTILTNGRDIEISGAALTVGNIDTTLTSQVAIAVDAGGPIPEGAPNNTSGTSTFTFTVPDGIGLIRDLDVRFAAEHTYVGDLRVELTAPEDPRDGERPSVILFENVGGAGQNFQDTVLDSDATVFIRDSAAPFSGTFAPEGNLGDFDDLTPQGEWTLTVNDDFEQDSGRLLQADDDANWGSVSAGTQLLITTGSADGDGGQINLTANNGDVTAGDLIASSQGGVGGDISVNANGGNVVLAGSRILSNSVNDAGGENFNNIRLSASERSVTNPANRAGGSVNLDQAELSVQNSRDGFAGDIFVAADNEVNIANSSLSANGNQGRVFIGSISDVVAGGIPQTVRIVNSQITSSNSIDETFNGNVDIDAGTIEILAAERIEISAQSSLTSSASGEGNGGAIAIDAPTIEVDQALLSAATDGEGEGGAITVRSERLTFRNQSRVSTRARASAAGDGGIIDLNASETLILESGARLDAGTSGRGNGGNIIVSTFIDPANPTVEINPNGILQLDNGSITAGSELIGNSGNIDIDAGRVVLSAGSSIASNTNGVGNAGQIDILTANTDPNQFAVSLDNSTLSADLGGRSSGQGQEIRIQTDSLSLTNGARIETETFGRGNAGNIIIESDRAINIAGFNASGFNSGISTSSGGLESGEAGNILINQGNPRGAMTLSDNGFLSSGTRSASDGGTIAVEVDTLNIASGGQILSSTLGNGNAGAVLVTAQTSITLAGEGTEFDFDTVEDPFSDITLTALTFDAVANPEQEERPGATFANVSRLADQDTAFDYYSFEVSSANSQGIFDIDNGVTNDSTTSIDTELFLFNRNTGELLASNDDAPTTLGGTGSSSNLDAFIDFLFADPGQYVVGVGQFDSFAASGSLIDGAPPAKGQTYDLRVSLENQGRTAEIASPNPNQGLSSSILASSGRSLQESETLATVTPTIGAAGTVSIDTPTLTLRQGGQVSVNSEITSNAPTGGAIAINLTDPARDGNPNRVLISGPDSRISAETQGGAPAGNITLTGPQLTIQQGARLSVTATDTARPQAGSPEGQITVDIDQVTLNGLEEAEEGDQSGIFAETQGAAPAGSLRFVATGDRSNITVNFTDGAEISASTQGTANGGDIDFEAPIGQINLAGDGRVSVESIGTATAGILTFVAQTLALEDGIEVSAETDVGRGGVIRLGTPDHPLQRLEVIDTRISASSTQLGRAGDLQVFTTDSILLRGTVTRDGGPYQAAGLFVEAIGGGDAGDMRLETGTLTIDRGAAAGVSSIEAGIPGLLTVRADDLQLNQGRLRATSENGQGDRNDAGIRLLGLTRLDVRNGSEITASTETGTSGNIDIEASESVFVGGSSRIAAEAIAPNSSLAQDGRAGTLRVSTGQLTLTNADITVSAQDGNAGRLIIRADDARLIDNSTVRATTLGGQSNRVQLQGQNLLVQDSLISASTETGQAGDVRINARESVVLNGVTQLAGESVGGVLVRSTEGGTAGDLRISTSTLSIENGARVSVSNTDDGSGGDLRIRAADVAIANGGSVIATTEAGVGGDVEFIRLEQLTLEEGSQISASTESGKGGSLQIFERPSSEGSQLRLSGGSQITAASTAGGTAGDLRIIMSQITLDSSDISVSSTADGGAGRLTVEAETVRLRNRASMIATTENGEGDDIRFRGLETLAIADSLISASTTTGTAGQLTLEADTITLRGQYRSDEPAGLSVEAQAAGGNAGDLRILANRLTLRDGAEASVSNQNSRSQVTLDVTAEQVSLRQGGRITADSTSGLGGNIRFSTLDRLTLADDSQISSSTRTGQAGNITLDNSSGGQAAGVNQPVPFASSPTLRLSNGSSITANTGRGRGGNIELLNLTTLQMLEGSSISASTRQGRGGRLRIDVQEDTELDDRSAIQARATRGGNAGSIEINVLEGDLSVSDRSRIIATAEQGGNAGSILIRILEGNLDLKNRSQISVSSAQDGIAGNLTLQAETIEVGDRSRIEAETENAASRFAGGNLRLTANQAVSLTDGSLLSASTRAGNGGSLIIRAADELTLDTGSRAESRSVAGVSGEVSVRTNQVTVAGNSQLSASTVTGTAGNVSFEAAQTIEILNGGEVSSSATSGTAGNIVLNSAQNPAERVLLSGRNSRLAAEATEANGVAGSLTVNATDVRLEGGAQITVSSPSGQAGTLTIRGQQLALDNGKISAETGASVNTNEADETPETPQSDLDQTLSGSIRLLGFNAMSLGNESLIEANALEDATGGNITIEVPNGFILGGFPPTGPAGSDITANAESGNGGIIRVVTQGLIGIDFRTQLTPLNDITALSQAGGQPGTVELFTLGIDPSRGLSELPTNVVTTPPIDEACEVGASENQETSSEFVITGRGGLPDDPSNSQSVGVQQPSWVQRSSEASRSSQVLPTPASGSANALREVSPESTAAQPISTEVASADRTEIVEAQGWIISVAGEIVLVADSPETTAHSPQPGSPRECQAMQ